MCLDSLAMQWGRLDDFVVNNDQLVGGVQGLCLVVLKS